MKYRDEILAIVNASHDHPTAEDIYLKLKAASSKVVLATVYNNLNKLCEEGCIRRVSVDGSPDRFDRIVRHDHLICEQCGKLSDIQLSDLTDTIQSQLHEEMISYDLKIRYICPECRNKIHRPERG